MSSSFFGALTQGAKFDKKRFQKDVSVFKQGNGGRTANTSAATSKHDPLDFFGFNAAASKPEKHERKRKRTMSEEHIPHWAGNEKESKDEKKPKKKKHEGSGPRRRRKLSAGAEEEARLEEEERQLASKSLASKEGEKADKSGKKKTKSKKGKKKTRSESITSEVSNSSMEEPKENDSDNEDDVHLFQKDDSSVPNDTAKQEDDSAVNEKEAVATFRKQMGIRVYNTHVPAPIADFSSMQLPPKRYKNMKSVLLKNIEASEYKEPTPVQMQAIPVMLQHQDLVAVAPTGSGKTAAFAIPMLAHLGSVDEKPQGIRSIVMVPTRELAVQIHGEFKRLSAGRRFHLLLLSKATSSTLASQVSSDQVVSHDVLIATPLRLVHLLESTSLSLASVEIVCLDEADRLFEMGFVEQIDTVLAACTNKSVQRVLFSATMPEGVEEMAQSVLRDPIKVVIGQKNAGAASIDQKLLFVGKEEGKLVAMRQLAQEGLQVPCLLFVQDKDRAKQLYQELIYDGLRVGVVHADRSKEQRDDTIRKFRVGEVWLLICTDLMSRGMDFRAVNMVINYDFPQSAVSYIHRIGRTGRGGRTGKAVTFFTEEDMVYLRSIANVMKQSGCDVPDWMLRIKKRSGEKRKKLLKAPPQRHRISTVSGYDLKKRHKIQQTKQRNKQKRDDDEKEE